MAAIQGNVPRARNLPQLLNDSEVTQNHVAATDQAGGAVKSGRLPAPDVVIWPENATGLDPREYPYYLRRVWPAAAATAGKPILVGEVLQNPQRNVGPAVGARRGPDHDLRQAPAGPVRRVHPVPRPHLQLQLAALAAAGRTSPPAVIRSCSTSGQIRLGDVICYEVGFDDLVRSEVNAGANLIALQSNDADFEIDGQLGETEQQTAMARIRAIESDRAVVYASTTGESTIIAPDGAVIEQSGIWQRAILDARVPLVSYRTLADRVGAWPEYVLVLVTVLALGLRGCHAATSPQPAGRFRRLARVGARSMRTGTHSAGSRRPGRVTVRGTARIYASIVAAVAIGLLAAACSSAAPADAGPGLGRRVAAAASASALGARRCWPPS